MKRISDEKLNELIDNEGELSSGAISIMGVLRLALDLRDARADLVKRDNPYIFTPKDGLCHRCGEVIRFCKCEK